MSTNQLFQALTGKNINLWPFQAESAEILNSSKNLLLSAPTGTGKTWAGLIGFIDSWVSGTPHADRILYALPLRSLASSLYISTNDAIKQAIKSSLLTEQQRVRLNELEITIQTGDQKEDPFFDGDICFTTIDQLLTGFLNIPASLPLRLANINTGALIGSLVIIDEIHLLEPQRSLATLIEMGKQLSGLTQFLLMSATLSHSSFAWLQNIFQAEIIELRNQEMNKMPGQRDKKRKIDFIPKPLEAAFILKQHEKGRTIVICNTVERSQKIFRDILNRKASECEDCHVILLHSRYFKKDRQKKERDLSRWFGPEALQSNVILIATQVIEAGIDISAEVLHTEVCPANALLQRMGRCARYPNRNKGKCFVYVLEQNDKGQVKYGPYRSKLNQQFIQATESYIIKLSGQLLDYQEEKKLIDEVHSQGEQSCYAEIHRESNQTHRRVLATISQCDRSQISNLIRDIDSISIYIHGQPEDLDIFNGLELLSVPRTSLYHFKKILEQEQEPQEWIAKIPVSDDEERENSDYHWRNVRSFSELRSGWLVVFNPYYAYYDPEVGLIWSEAGKSMEPVYSAKAKIASYSYRMETYKQHAQNTLTALCHRDSNVIKARTLLAIKYGLNEVIIRDVEMLLCLLHDTGKLAEQYQQASRLWEIDRYPESGLNVNQPLAHTTYHPQTDWEVQRAKKYNRGKHAVEGAFAIADAFYQQFIDMTEEGKGEELLRVFLTAIARHHAPTAKSMTNIRFVPQACTLLNEIIQENGLKHNVENLIESAGSKDQKEFIQCLFDPSYPEQTEWLALYAFLIRRLRLADQESFAIIDERR